MAAGVAAYDLIFKRACSKLDIDPPDDLYSGNVESGEYTADEVRDAILEADAETYQAIAETPRHEARLRIGLASSSALTYAGEIPPDLPKHAGEIGDVLVQRTGGAWKQGEPARHPGLIAKWRENVGGYGDTEDFEGYYYVNGNEQIEFTGLAAKVDYVPEYEADRSTPACKCPESMQGHLVNGAVAKLRKASPDDRDLFDASEDAFEKGLARIRQRGAPGGEVMPDYQSARRRGAA
jgi:hypothetical protein